MRILNIAYERLKILGKEIKEKFEIVKGLKLSGSIADGHFFILQYGNKYVSSDYDIIVLLSRYPYEEEIECIREILTRPVYNNPVENLLLENIDIKLVTLEYPYKGEGVKIASVYDTEINLVRHLIGGKIIFGEEYFKNIVVEDEWVKRQLAYRVLERKKIFDIFTDLGAYDRIASILQLKNIRNMINEIIEKFKNYHKLTLSEINELRELTENIRGEIMNILNK
jgi:hypothetical protein